MGKPGKLSGFALQFQLAMQYIHLPQLRLATDPYL
jgi:hypothetical protein